MSFFDLSLYKFQVFSYQRIPFILANQDKVPPAVPSILKICTRNWLCAFENSAIFLTLRVISPYLPEKDD